MVSADEPVQADRLRFRRGETPVIRGCDTARFAQLFFEPG
jgi:hypothetical protein